MTALRPAAVPGGLLLFVAFLLSNLRGRWTSHVVSQGGLQPDAMLHVWQFWWFKRFLTGRNPLFDSHMDYYPGVASMTARWEGHLDLLLALPAVPWSPEAAHNLAAAGFMILAGLGAYALALHACADRWAAGGAALLFLLTPSIISELAQGRPEPLGVGLLGMSLASLARWFGGSGKRSLVLGLVAFALAICAYLPLAPAGGLMLGMLAAAYLLAGTSAGGGAARTAWVKRGLAVLLGLALLALPALVYAFANLEAWVLPSGEEASVRFQEWLAMSRGTSLTPGQLFGPFHGRAGAGLGMALPLAALLALVARGARWRALPCILTALLFAAMAMGPVLELGDHRFWSPYAWLPRLLPFWLRFHWPDRLLILGGLGLVVPASLALAWAGQLARGRLARLGQLALLVPILALAGWQVRGTAPLPVAALPVLPQSYQLLAADSPKAVVEVVATADPRFLKANRQAVGYHVLPQVAQMSHDAPFCCALGPVEYEPSELAALRSQDALFSYLTTGLGAPGPTDGDLAALGFSHVVLHGHGVGRRRGQRAREQKVPASDSCVPADYDKTLELLQSRYGAPLSSQRYGDGVLAVFRVTDRP